MTAIGWLSVISVIVALLTGGCDEDLSSNYEFIVRVSTQPGRALEGAGASLQGTPLGVSDSAGAISVTLRGREGDVVQIEVDCPAGHRPPQPLLVPLRRVGEGVKPEFSANCPPLTRSIVVAVRAEGGGHLPIVYLGRELTRTDSSGAAHLLLDVAAEDVVELVLDTTLQPRLRPRNPILRIQPGPSDEIAAMGQEFTLLPQPVARKRVASKGPTRID